MNAYAQAWRGDPVGQGNSQLVLIASGNSSDTVACLFKSRKYARNMLQKYLACTGQSRTARCSVEKANTQIFLQLLDGA